MDVDRFDTLARRTADLLTRRTVARAVAGALGLAFATTGSGNAFSCGRFVRSCYRNAAEVCRRSYADPGVRQTCTRRFNACCRRFRKSNCDAAKLQKCNRKVSRSLPPPDFP